METDSRGVVGRLYGALDADDVPGMLALCSDGASVVYPAAGALPCGGQWHGAEEIARFLELHDQAEEIRAFDVIRMAMDGTHVFVQGHFAGRSKRTGRTWETDWVHVFDVRDERIDRWQAFFDTGAALAAHRVAPD
jgi:ketosteroid isomerase-like protein